jgi:hypothetical protein
MQQSVDRKFWNHFLRNCMLMNCRKDTFNRMEKLEEKLKKLIIIALIFNIIPVMLLFYSEVMSYFNAATSVFQNKRFP